MKYLRGNTHSLIFLINPFFIPYNYEELEENKMKFNNFYHKRERERLKKMKEFRKSYKTKGIHMEHGCLNSNKNR